MLRSHASSYLFVENCDMDVTVLKYFLLSLRSEGSEVAYLVCDPAFSNARYIPGGRL